MLQFLHGMSDYAPKDPMWFIKRTRKTETHFGQAEAHHSCDNKRIVEPRTLVGEYGDGECAARPSKKHSREHSHHRQSWPHTKCAIG
jgi:hypothetical protein